MPERTETVFEEIGRHDCDTAWTSREGQAALAVKCEVCRAPRDRKCVNPMTGKPRKLPCIGRIVRSTPRKEQR